MTDPIAVPIPETGVPESAKVELTPMEPIHVTVIGTPRNENAPKTQLIETPHGQRDVLVRFVTPFVSIALGFVYAFGTTLIGLISAGMTTQLIPATDFADLVVKCATLSVAGAAFGALKDFVVIVGRLRDKYPLSGV